jgi:hypothetical protein
VGENISSLLYKKQLSFYNSMHVCVCVCVCALTRVCMEPMLGKCSTTELHSQPPCLEFLLMQDFIERDRGSQHCLVATNFLCRSSVMSTAGCSSTTKM